MNCLRLLAVGLLFAGCRPGAPAPGPAAEAPQAPTNRIDVPAPVRRNLGIEFVTVERRHVAATMRVTGSFELLPQGRREYRTPLPGRVEVLARQLQTTATGEVLYRIDSPAWHATRRELGELHAAVRIARDAHAALVPLVAAHREHEQSLQRAVALMDARVAELERIRAEVGGQAAELTTARVEVARLVAELAEAREQEAETGARMSRLAIEIEVGEDRAALALAAAAALVDLPVAALAARVEGGAPAWREQAEVSVRAVAAGVVDALPVASGAWVEAGDLVLATSDPQLLRFHGRALQSDLARLRNGLRCAIVPAQLGSAATPLQGVLQLGIGADPALRTVDLFVEPERLAEWARPGLAAYLEIETGGSGGAELAVPLSALVQDGLQRVLFRRTAPGSDQVIRVEADVGVDDGRWVVVKSGLADGDEVVLVGAYELMLASSGTATRGGHFHADGTFHEDGK